MAKRRPAGDGMIRKRTDGHWEGRIVVGHKDNGDPIFRYVSGKTQKELLAKLHQQIEMYRDVELVEDSNLTLSEWMERWLTEYLPDTIRSSTLKCYQLYTKNYVLPYLGDKVVSKITSIDIQRLYTKLAKDGRINKDTSKGSGLSNTTIRRVHSMLHLAMDRAVQEHLTARNPTEGAVVPKADCKPKQILTEAQLNTFMDTIKEDPIWHDFFYTELTTGLRRGEICGLMWTDFDAAKNTLKVRRTILVENGQLVAGEPKTGQSSRTLLLPSSTAQLLKERKKTSFSRWIFPNPIRPESPTSPNTAYTHLKQLLKKAGLPDIRFHDLRHTFAPHALASGVDAKTLSGILGHTNASFTLDTYTHVTGDMQKRASGIVGNFMEDIFGKELKPWQESARLVTEPSA